MTAARHTVVSNTSCAGERLPGSAQGPVTTPSGEEPDNTESLELEARRRTDSSDELDRSPSGLSRSSSLGTNSQIL